MKKTTLKAFTLVEMLIVIVIIGILIASLMPRMQSAQGRARDVARKNDLSQIQTAIITSWQDRGDFPGMGSNTGINVTNKSLTTTGAADGLNVSQIGDNLIKAGMSSVPTDPNKSNAFSGVGTVKGSGGEYRYVVTKKNGINNGGFALMAGTEVEGSSNYVYCDGTYAITGGTDISNITLCSTVIAGSGSSDCSGHQTTCKYGSLDQLRYVVLY